MFTEKLFFYNFVILITFCNVNNVHAKNADDLKQNFMHILMECAKDYPITGDDVEQFKNKQVPDNENMRCLLACAYKKTGMMDDQGMLSVEGVNKYTQEYLGDDSNKLEKAHDFTDVCKSVNDVSVSDGSKGCDRAALMFKCSVDKAAEALTDEQVMMRYTKYVMACAKGKPVEMTDLMKLQQLEVPTKTEVKCVVACAYRRMGTLRSDGMFDQEASYKFAEECKEGDEKRLENGKKLADMCLKVNDEEVSDGDKGCERAALMFKCLTTNAPKVILSRIFFM
ncbi:uncharacterized protein LOC112054384 [Bicyclus anynana]|uniref:Uncharacterized protein LOC112054384 n=1 Tax=Bicyclus anynana TaxID=110368 RepID=A0A6J1NYT2_BICAN|nr:uncharacterized protein LOC112054384 [Bicyclus anynana]